MHRISSHDASWFVRQANLLRRLPGLRGALRDGSTTTGHVASLAAVVTNRRQLALCDVAEQLVGFATSLEIDEFSAGCQRWAELADEHTSSPPHSGDYHLTITPGLYGEANISGHLTLDQVAMVSAAIETLNGPDPSDAPVKRTLRRHNADALADLAQRHLGGEDGRPAPSTTGATTSSATVRRAKPSATVIIDFGSFSEARFWHDQLDAETIWDDPSYRSLASVRQDLLGTGHIPSRTASLLTCDANVRRHVLDPHGQPLNLGRSTPTVTSSQRHALVVGDRGCVFPTCDRPPQWTDAHYIHPRALDGFTDLDNLVLLCRHHHRLVHGPEWSIERHPVTGHISALRRNGWVYQRDHDGVVRPDRAPPPDGRAG